MVSTMSSSLLKDTKYVLERCREAPCPVIVQVRGSPTLVIMDAAAFDYQFKKANKLPKGHMYVAYRPLRMPITTLKYMSKTVDACDQANEPIYLQKFNMDELVIMSFSVYERIQRECKPRKRGDYYE